jgi:hypothetical protein
MIIALFDYISYRAKRGRYSRISIEREGGNLASPELYGFLKEARPLDSMLYHGSNSFLSWTVMYFTNCVWSHVASFGENGYLYDMTTHGYIKHHFSSYLDGNGYIILRRPKQPPNQEQIQKAIQWAEARIGCPFSWKNVLWMGVEILLGSHHNYHFRISLDFLIFCAVFLPVGLLNHVFGYIILSVMIVYCCIVLVNRPRRIEDAKKLFRQEP